MCIRDRRYRATLALRRGETEEALRRLNGCAARLARLTNPPETRLEDALVLLHSARMSAHHCRGELALAAAAGAEADRLYHGSVSYTHLDVYKRQTIDDNQTDIVKVIRINSMYNVGQERC